MTEHFITIDDLVKGSAADRVGEVCAKSRISEYRRFAAWYTLLVRQTLQYAELHVPFYRERAKLHRRPYSKLFNCLSDLRSLPILQRADLVNEARALISEDSVPDKVVCTTGTTGRHLKVYGCRKEEMALSALHRVGARACEKQRPIGLRISGANRRLQSSHAGDVWSAHVLKIHFSTIRSLSNWFDHVDHVIEILSQKYLFDGHEAGITSLHITPPWLFEFITKDILDRGVEPAHFGIKTIALSGDFVTSRQRKFVSEHWAAKTVSSFSFTEAVGFAREQEGAEGSYTLPPHLYWEIVDRCTLEPVKSGEAGLLLVTTLFPFQQVTPLVRYQTGDIVQSIRNEFDFCPSIRPIGRDSQTVELGPRAFVGPRDVNEAICHFDLIPRIPHPRYLLKMETAHDHRRLVLSLEATLIQGEGHNLGELIAARLGNEIQSYGYPEALMPTAIECRIVPKGTLAERVELSTGR